ncbi:MAG: YchJ family metal-binding protein [Nonlabens sp.]|nr:YchJ family metal-binding protein [Nonlabens sp.]MDP5100645.1 YchJ family metal-binding protein [Nonlabens sp.]
MPSTCPCNPHKTYKTCCAIAHENIAAVTTAQQLMRSRYSAFVMGNVNYLQHSQHSSTRISNHEADEIGQWTKTVQWVKLEVLTTTQGLVCDSLGTVHFKALYIENGQLQIIEENSSFVREDGCWVYVGEHTC